MSTAAAFVPNAGVVLTTDLAPIIGDSEAHLILAQLIITLVMTGLVFVMGLGLYKEIMELAFNAPTGDPKTEEEKAELADKTKKWKSRMRVLIMQLQPNMGAFLLYLGISMAAVVNYGGLVDCIQFFIFGGTVPQWQLLDWKDTPKFNWLNLYNFVAILPGVMVPLTLNSYSHLLKTGAMIGQVGLGVLYAAFYVWLKEQYWSKGFFAATTIFIIIMGCIIAAISIFYSELRHHRTIRQRLFWGNIVTIGWFAVLGGVMNPIGGAYYIRYNTWFDSLLADSIASWAVALIAIIAYNIAYSRYAPKLEHNFLEEFSKFGNEKTGAISDRKAGKLIQSVLDGDYQLPNTFDLKQMSTKKK